MREDQKNEIAILAEEYEKKRQLFECQQMLNTYGKTSKELLKMALAYHAAETEMFEAMGRLDRAKRVIYERS